MKEDFYTENTHQKAFLLQMYCFTSSIPVLNCVPEPHHVSVYVGWTSTARHLEETTWNRPMQREREDYAIPIPYWATPTFIKHSRAPQSDSTPDVFEGGEKDHLCLIKVYIKIILILIIHQQKRIAWGPLTNRNVRNVQCLASCLKIVPVHYVWVFLYPFDTHYFLY